MKEFQAEVLNFQFLTAKYSTVTPIVSKILPVSEVPVEGRMKC